jgi:hypothetical protein
MLLSLETLLIVGALVVPIAGATRTSCNGQGRIGRPGSENMRKRELGFPRNLGDPVISTEEARKGIPGNQPQARRLVLGGGESEINRVRSWYRQAKETKRGGRDDRKSQCLDSTEEAGELDPRGPGGWEARHRSMELLLGDTTNA